jgi:hypothetical protein
VTLLNIFGHPHLWHQQVDLARELLILLVLLLLLAVLHPQALVPAALQPQHQVLSLLLLRVVRHRQVLKLNLRQHNQNKV